MNRTLYIIIFFMFNFVYSNMVTPDNGSHLNYIHVLFEWEQINDAESYNLQISEFDNFSDIIINLNTSNLIHIEKNYIEWNSNYYWRVQPVFNNGSTGNWLDTFNFSTGSTRSEAYVINHNNNLYSDGLTIFSSFFNYFTAMIDQNGNEIWNTENNNIVYYNTDFFGQYYGCFVDNSLENYLPGIEFSIDNEFLWSEPNNHFLHHEIFKLNDGNYMGLIETTQLGPIPNGDWSSTFQFLGYEADGVSNEFPWVGDKIVIWDKDTKQVIWEWDTFDNFSMLDFDTESTWELALTINRFDWTHANAFLPVYDDQGNLESIYLSSRHLSRITKIDYPSGNIDWNLGLDMPSGDVDCGQELLFSFQHSINVEENGNIIFLDNGNLSQILYDSNNPTSRGFELEVIDTDSGCETEVVWEYILPSDFFGYASGNVQKLDNGNYLLVTIGDTGTALEVTPNNQLVWEGKFGLQEPNGAVYRANRVSGLYPVAIGLVIPNVYKNEDDLFFLNQDDIEFIVQNAGSSAENFEIKITYDNDFSNSETIYEYINADSEENYSFNIPSNTNIAELQITPKHRPDLEKKIIIYLTNDNDCDYDGDGICDDVDTCPYDYNNDSDGDGICDNDDICPYDYNDDSDNDGSCDNLDICIGNDLSGDTDGDGICNSNDLCPDDYFNDFDNDGLCNNEDPCPDDSLNDCINQDPCEENFIYLSNIPNSTIVLDNSNCFESEDLNVLNDIISLNNLNVNSPLHLGTQNWNNGRLTRIEIGNYYQGGNVLLTDLPNTIGNLDQLGVLYINENELTYLPASITNLNNLVYLVLSFNLLTSLPENIGDLSNLIWIDAGYNELESIPQSISELENLMYLWIFNNNLTYIHDSICQLNLNWNDLDYGFLPYFGCGGNQLCDDVPPCIENSDNFNTSIDPLYYSFVITVEQECEESCLIMDVNNDGLINVVDIVNTVNIIFNITNPTNEELCAADANQDSIINVVDIVNIVNFIFEN